MNSISAANQSMCFLFSVLLGAGIGAVYDIFRIVRIATGGKTAIVFIQDVLFCFIAAIISFVFILSFNDGVVRWYIIAGEAAGFAIYYNTVGVLVYKSAKAIIGLIKRFLSFVFYPLRVLLSFIIKICKKTFKFCKQILQNYFIFVLGKCKIIAAKIFTGRPKRKSVSYSPAEAAKETRRPRVLLR